ncbi:bifunctional DNA primase/polymerase [Nonomuraea sp. NPDC050556]|uniref:bifunctional DNA primase/polymerase n=1 Tax=Nonomuraea sp. NPDC050556 TaxID=3364369 RepID=UPI0037A3837F
MPNPSTTPLNLAMRLAGYGWHILPLSPTSKRPLANCPTCTPTRGAARHPIDSCPCLPAGRWCHGVRAATTDPDRLTAWWRSQPHAVPGVAAGPSGLILIDLDTHATDPPANAATELLPGIDLTGHPIAAHAASIRTGLDTLALLARLRGGTHPWPIDPDHQPVVTVTPSGGRHLWYRAPAAPLRQAIGQLGWQIDIKVGWNYGIAPGATTAAGTYTHRSGHLTAPGYPPTWLAREVARVASPVPLQRRHPYPPPRAPRPDGVPGRYLTTVINRGAAELAKLKLQDGRQRRLSALAYQAGGLLAWSGLPEHQVTSWLIAAGEASDLPTRLAARIVHRALLNGIGSPVTPAALRHALPA